MAFTRRGKQIPYIPSKTGTNFTSVVDQAALIVSYSSQKEFFHGSDRNICQVIFFNLFYRVLRGPKLNNAYQPSLTCQLFGNQSPMAYVDE